MKRGKSETGDSGRETGAGPSHGRAAKTGGRRGPRSKPAWHLLATDVQRKVAVGPAEDPREHEADRAADAVMRMPEGATRKPGEVVQRACSECEEEAQRQVADEETEEGPLQAKPASVGQRSAGSEGASLPRGGGEPMSPAQRSFFEPRFGRDFGGVRLHTGDEAARSAKAIDARAFTYRNDIVFGAGQLSAAGGDRHLLAHELAHVVQQGHAPEIDGGEGSFQPAAMPPRLQTKKEKKPKKKETRRALDAQKLMWEDLGKFFPNDSDKLAGSGYDDSIDYLRTSFSEESSEGVSTSAPIVYVGAKYAKLDDPDKRKELLGQEVEKIRSWTQTKVALGAQQKFWTDLHTFSPDGGRKLAGSGYDASIAHLRTSFDSGSEGGTSTSAPIVYVGKDYVSEPDDSKREGWVTAELAKIDAWRFTNALLENADLADTAVKERLEDLDAPDKLSYIGRLEAQKHRENAEVVSYLQKVMQSTPIEAGATLVAGGGFELTIDNIHIVVLPDVYDSAEVASGGKTKVDHNIPVRTTPANVKTQGGRVISMGAAPTVPTVECTIVTHYAPGASPRAASSYGVGTRGQDVTAEEKSLRHHEGAHGTEFVSAIRAGAAVHKYPLFTGNVNDTVGGFQTAMATYESQQKAFQKMVSDAAAHQEAAVDCPGKSIVQHKHEQGETTNVQCP